MLAQTLVDGIVLGALFALLGSGLTLVFGVMDVPNFAQAGVITLAAYVMLWLQRGLGLTFWLAVLGGVLFAGVLSAATERLAYRFVRTRPLAAPVVALGLLLVLDNTALAIWGGDHVSLSPPYEGALLRFGGIHISGVALALLLAAAVSLAAVQLFLHRTSVGRAIRAVSQNSEAASLLGISPQTQYMTAFFVSGLLAGVAAFAYAPTYAVFPYMADAVLLNAFVVVILGGLGNVWGAMLGGLLLGVVETLGAVYVSAAYQTVFGFLLLLLMLVVRPSGLFGGGARRVA
ncbi:branched-chain amino acid ABC transporter permease [Lichenicoccus sp.]|uniref:branched-chain amino acid ABC transporter permease n=1 Tax=Lichenicoccus sp. TaxID=2781899 RepID=UPI003D11AB21